MTKKNLKVLILFSLISVFIFLITGCSSDSEDALSSTRSYDVNFTVADQNEEAVAASVKLAGETKTTNGDGVVSFSKVNGKYDYEVSAESYDKFADSIVVDGKDFTVDVKLNASTSSDSEPEDTDDNTPQDPGDSDSDEGDDNTSQDPGESEPGDTEESDTIPPSLVKLFGWINKEFHGLDNFLIDSIDGLEDINKDLNQSFDYLIVYFSEKVKTEAELLQDEDFEVYLINVDPNEKIVIAEALLNPEFLVLKIDQRFKLDSYKGLIRLEITDEGRKKITDIAGNMLAENPSYLELEIKK